MGRPLTLVRLGVLLPVRECSETSNIAEVLRVGVEMERLGADSVWVGDSLFARPRFDPLTVLAALAVRTTRVAVGTAVLVAPMWNPLLLARAAATVDTLAEGRLVLGLGPGPSYGPARKEFAALGISSSDRIDRLEEIITVCRALWSSDGPVDVNGSRWQFRNVDLFPKPVRPGGPPIWLGVRGPRGMKLAARLGDGWLPIVRSSQEYGIRRDELAGTRAGRNAAVYLTVAVHDDEIRAEGQLRQWSEHYYRAPWSVVNELEDSCAGTAAKVADRIAAYARQGAGEVILRFAGGDIGAQFGAIVDATQVASAPSDPDR